jgi:predicted SAM-dependent methyltransferase
LPGSTGTILPQPRLWSEGDGLGNGAINYACGSKPLRNWVNVDIFDGSFRSSWTENPTPGVDIQSVFNFDLLAPHPFGDDSFDFAYCEDFVEHLDQRESILFLTEVLRTLKCGGILRISTPSLDGVLRQHFQKPDRSVAYFEADRAFTDWGHKHFFMHETLREMTYSLGFSGYEICEYGESKHALLRDRETRPSQIGLNLYAEIGKPI